MMNFFTVLSLLLVFENATAKGLLLRQTLDLIVGAELSTPKEFKADNELTLGLKFEEKQVQLDWEKRAKAYLDFKNSRNGIFTESYLKTCQQDPQNAFCDTVEKRIPANASEKSKRLSSHDFKRLKEKLKKGQASELNEAAFSDVIRALGSFNDYSQLKPLAQELIKDSSCASSGLLTALGAKAEEYFPEAEYIELSRSLYRKASRCHTDATSQRARFRLALIQIWQNDCSEASQLLQSLESNSEAQAYHSRTKYWRHFCASTMGKADLAQETKDDLFKKFPMSFHNIAVNGADAHLVEKMKSDTPVKFSYRSVIRPDLNEMIRATEALMLLGQTTAAAEFVDQRIDLLDGFEPEVRFYLAVIMNRAGQALPKFKIMSSLFSDAPRMITQESLKLYFPLWFFDLLKEQNKGVDPLLLISLIRQESAFNSNARSIVGARGLMQVMPATARHIASVKQNRLYEPKTNISVGTKYFMHRLQQYSGDVELTLAAYNAGFTRVDKWLKRYPVGNKLLFMDLIPFKETRDYVASILRNYYWYVKLYTNLNLDATVDGGPKLNPAGAKVLAIMSGNSGADP